MFFEVLGVYLLGLGIVIKKAKALRLGFHISVYQFRTLACTSILIDLLSSYIRHVFLLSQLLTLGIGFMAHLKLQQLQLNTN